MSYIEMKNIKKIFDGKLILKDVSLSIEKGEFVTFLGPSGCGKTTMLRCLVGLEQPDSGSIILDGADITHLPANQRGVSMIFQQYSLFPTMNVYDNVSFGLRMKSLAKDEIQSRVAHVLKMLEMSGHEKKYPFQLSGGEQQRVALARCLIMNPKVLLLDEPFSAVDAKLRKELQIYIKAIHKELNMTSVFVTHDQEEAMRISDTIHLFNHGVLEQSGKPKEVYARPATPFVTGFIGSYNQIDGADFQKMSGCAYRIKEMAAFRPEIIQMSAQNYEPGGDYYYMQGVITGYIPQGNVVRYNVAVGAKMIDVDIIFDTDLQWVTGQQVFLRIKKENVLIF
ncbi:MAG: ABC transporter ATP-binding protein [Clostridia bacterium]|jgi:putative spermidine/putrescine transport system ATP-binding protein|nr:ABC transporter ATP-binding protein [Clostridia bacterium]